MTRRFHCDADGCGYSQETPLPFEVNQRLDELDDDGDQVTVEIDICSVACLSDYAMGLQMEFPDPEGETG